MLSLLHIQEILLIDKCMIIYPLGQSGLFEITEKNVTLKYHLQSILNLNHNQSRLQEKKNEIEFTCKFDDVTRNYANYYNFLQIHNLKPKFTFNTLHTEHSQRS